MFEKSSNTKLHEHPSSGSRVVPRGRIDGRTQTDMTKLKAVFRNFAKAPKKSCVGGEVKWHNIYTKFCEKVWTCSKLDMRDTHTKTAWWTREPTFSFLSMSLGWKVVRVGCRRRWHINIECNHSLSRDGSVDIVTRSRAGWSRFRIPAGKNKLYLLQKFRWAGIA